MAKAVETFANISAEDLLSTAPRLFNWVRKEDNTGLRSVMNKLLDWPWYFMILRTGCLYLYKKSDSPNFCEAIPLTKYRVCDAQDVTKYRWVFKLVHSSEVKTLFFAVDTDFDLKKWKDAIIEEKEKYCCITPQENGAPQYYCEIDDPPICGDSPAPKEPPPPPPSRQPRAPAPLPEVPGPRPKRRPHSLSSPEPLEPGYIFKPRNHPLLPPKQESPRSPNPPEHPRKLPTMPRPPLAVQGKPKSPASAARDPLQRSSSESLFGVKAEAGFDNVLKQLEGTRLSHIRKKDTVSSAKPNSTVGLTHSKFKTGGRGHPDGCESSKGKYKEVAMVTPDRDLFAQSAYQMEMTKESACSAIKSERLGTYLTRPSTEAESKRSLSVRDQNEEGMPLVRHYRIFYKEGLGYALDTKGPRFESISKLLQHYYQNELPNTKGKLCCPYRGV